MLSIIGHRDVAAAGASLALLLLATPAWADDTSTKDSEPTLYLGKVSVTGQREIVSTQRAIKTALRAPLSNDPAHADDMVCRISKGLGEQHEYLDCATNGNLTRQRNALHTSALVGTYGQPTGGDRWIYESFLTCPASPSQAGSAWGELAACVTM